MTKEKAYEKIEILSKVLKWEVYYSEDKIVMDFIEAIYQEAKRMRVLREDIKRNEENFRDYYKLKEFDLVDDFISNCCCAYDVSIDLNISERKAKKKLKKLNFTEKEKDILVKSGMGGIKYYFERLIKGLN